MNLILTDRSQREKEMLWFRAQSKMLKKRNPSFISMTLTKLRTTRDFMISTLLETLKSILLLLLIMNMLTFNTMLTQQLSLQKNWMKFTLTILTSLIFIFLKSDLKSSIHLTFLLSSTSMFKFIQILLMPLLITNSLSFIIDTERLIKDGDLKPKKLTLKEKRLILNMKFTC